MHPRTLALLGFGAVVGVAGALALAFGRNAPDAEPDTFAVSGLAPVATDTLQIKHDSANSMRTRAAPPNLPESVTATPTKPPTMTPRVRPHLERATPNTADISIGTPIEVELRGTGFTPTGNAVLFGTLNAGVVNSTNGTTVRFMVPTHHPPRGEVAPMTVQAGEYGVSIKNSNGTSDTLTITLRSGPP